LKKVRILGWKFLPFLHSSLTGFIPPTTLPFHTMTKFRANHSEECHLQEETLQVTAYDESSDPMVSTRIDEAKEENSMENFGEKPVLMAPATNSNMLVAILQAIMTLFFLKYYPPGKVSTVPSPSKKSETKSSDEKMN
jgi:hypothetical protein